MLNITTRLIGKWRETQAERFLQTRGLVTIARNFQCRLGEIDLIMQQQSTLVFVEVRYRKHTQFGSAAETVTRNKQQKLLHTAQYFLTQNTQFQQLDCRFDIIGIGNNDNDIEWLEDAFSE